MPRPRKRRRLRHKPRQLTFKPAGVALNDLRLVQLRHEELEALRLADLEGLTQTQAAESMGVSRSTFQRMLTNARRQTAMALVEGQALSVEGGDYVVAERQRHGPRRRRD